MLTTNSDIMAIMPDVTELEKVSKVVANAVAMDAVASGVTMLSEQEVSSQLEKHFWQPSYCSYLLAHQKSVSTID